MTDTLRILILEDNPADAELVQFELREAGLDFRAKVVTSQKDFLRELDEYCPDVILSDYDLPQYDGASALAETRTRCPEVPFILVTGAISEDRAIEILTGGAKDYVMKSRLSRLAPAVLRALAEAKEHRARKLAEEELRAASFYSRSLIEASLDPLVTISAEGKITDVNEATIKVTGISREGLIGTDFSIYFTEPDKARGGYRQVFERGFVTDYPLTIRHRNGAQTHVLYNASVYRDVRGSVLGVFAAARDVTAQKRAEAEVAEQRTKELERLAELERFQKLTVGRELKMIELKKEIEELKRARAENG
jgi:PAS domain S-box-containing protein